MALCDDQEKRLACIMDRTIGQERLVMGGGRAIGDFVEILPCQHGDHARCRPDVGEVYRRDRATRDGRQAKGQMQAIGGRWDVIDIARAPRHMQAGRIMRQAVMRANDRTSSTLTASPLLSRK